ncbi:MAG: hypothetical protein A2Y40_05600 [Candidatus Margulisbacteria bacterium GWF2_35_9]|nr:MAG: hypothetical protein A2Y40_05600 [Candidatus Margulisbacteria bacterium GWF2_35_9]
MADKTKEAPVPEAIPETVPLLKRKSTLIIILSVVLIFLILISTITVVVLTHRPEPKEKKETDQIYTIIPMRDFLVNLVDYGGRRYLKVSLSLELENIAVKTEIETKDTILRNYIINILSSKTFDDIKSVEGKDNLRKAIILKCNFLLKSGKVLNVYFNDFIIQ